MYLRSATAQVALVLQAAPRTTKECAWWNLVCQGGQEMADSSLNALTQSMVNGLLALFGQITKIVDESTRVPLSDPVYRDTYYGFAGLAVPVIAAVYFVALLAAALRRDPRALVRATVGVAVAAIGGAVYVLFAQLLVALDDWLAHGVVAVTGADFGEQMTQIANKFELMGAGGVVAANFLMIILMFAALLAGVVLWFVLLLRKMAILVVVVFAPLLIAGMVYPPTRAWVRKATEVLVALVFCKSVIYVIFGVGMSLLLRDSQSLSDFVGVIVLLTGACFAPLVMLRLVHFAADSQLAGEMVGTLRAGAQPAVNRLGRGSAPGLSRGRMAEDYASRGGSSARGGQATVSAGGPRSAATGAGGSGSAAGASGSSSQAATGAAGASGAAAGPVGIAVAAGAVAAGSVAKGAKRSSQRAATALSESTAQASDPPRPVSPGPSTPDREV